VNEEPSEQSPPEQPGAEQGGHHRGAPGSGAEEAPRDEAEVRARIEEQIRNLKVQDLMVESVVSVLNLTARRLAKEDERDLAQAKVGIEAVRAWLGLLPEEAATQIRNALSELQMLYAQAVEGGEKAGSGGTAEGQGPGAQPAPDRGTPGSGAEEVPRKSGQPPPRLWTPPGSSG
jgi:hypothetical protein